MPYGLSSRSPLSFIPVTKASNADFGDSMSFAPVKDREELDARELGGVGVEHDGGFPDFLRGRASRHDENERREQDESMFSRRPMIHPHLPRIPPCRDVSTTRVYHEKKGGNGFRHSPSHEFLKPFTSRGS